MIIIGYYVPEERMIKELEEWCDLLQSCYGMINKDYYIIITGHLNFVFRTFI
jgi:hypothetical protein